MTSLIDALKAARRTATPLVAVTTQDQRAFMARAMESLNGADTPYVTWDAVRGVRAANERAAGILAKFGEPKELAMQTGNPAAMLDFASNLPAPVVLFMLNAHRFVADAVVATGIGNLRDLYKQDQRMLILLGPSMALPVELQQDVVVLDEPALTDPQLAAVIGEVYEGANMKAPADVKGTVDAVRGLCAFAAEQVAAMALRKEGMDDEAAWERKRAQVNQTKGLTMTITKKAAPVAGLKNIMDLCDRLASRGTFRAVLRIDEIEKQMAGNAGDTSGVSQDATGAILRAMEDFGWTGFIAVGGPGTGKSLVSKVIGARAGVPTLEMDLGAVKGSLVGQSEGQVREVIKVVQGVADGRVLVIATCNKLASLPPELRRRFKLGIFYFGLPSAEERAAIWQLYREGTTGELPDSDGWTGAEIRNVCEIARDTGFTLAEAARYIVPVSVADPKALADLQAQAEGRFLSASEPGVYRSDAQAATGARKFKV